MLLDKKQKLSKRVPAFMVTENVRNQLDELSSRSGLSIGEILRRSVSLFLTEIANEICTKSDVVSELEKSA